MALLPVSAVVDELLAALQSAAQVMLDWISEQGLEVLTWEREAVQPTVDDHALLPSLSGVRDARGLARVNLAEALLRLLDWPLRQRLNSQLPSHYTVPTGHCKSPVI